LARTRWAKKLTKNVFTNPFFSEVDYFFATIEKPAQKP